MPEELEITVMNIGNNPLENVLTNHPGFIPTVTGLIEDTEGRFVTFDRTNDRGEVMSNMLPEAAPDFDFLPNEFVLGESLVRRFGLNDLARPRMFAGDVALAPIVGFRPGGKKNRLHVPMSVGPLSDGEIDRIAFPFTNSRIVMKEPRQIFSELMRERHLRGRQRRQVVCFAVASYMGTQK